MKTIIRIGYQDYLLPASANVNLLLKTLGDAVELESKLESKFLDAQQIYFPCKDHREIEVRVVRDSQVLDGKQKLLKEKAGPDANGDHIESTEDQP